MILPCNLCNYFYSFYVEYLVIGFIYWTHGINKTGLKIFYWNQKRILLKFMTISLKVCSNYLQWGFGGRCRCRSENTLFEERMVDWHSERKWVPVWLNQKSTDHYEQQVRKRATVGWASQRILALFLTQSIELSVAVWPFRTHDPFVLLRRWPKLA